MQKKTHKIKGTTNIYEGKVNIQKQHNTERKEVTHKGRKGYRKDGTLYNNEGRTNAINK